MAVDARQLTEQLQKSLATMINAGDFEKTMHDLKQCSPNIFYNIHDVLSALSEGEHAERKRTDFRQEICDMAKLENPSSEPATLAGRFDHIITLAKAAYESQQELLLAQQAAAAREAAARQEAARLADETRQQQILSLQQALQAQAKAAQAAEAERIQRIHASCEASGF